MISRIITLVLLLNAAACSEARTCTLEESTAVFGTIYDKNGDPVLPDRVLLVIPLETQECFLVGPAPDPTGYRDAAPPTIGDYSCFPLGNHAQLQVYVGEEIVTRELEFHSDGCHTIPQEIDIHL